MSVTISTFYLGLKMSFLKLKTSRKFPVWALPVRCAGKKVNIGSKEFVTGKKRDDAGCNKCFCFHSRHRKRILQHWKTATARGLEEVIE